MQDKIKLQLPNVTLFGIDSLFPEGLTRAAEICKENIDFGSVVVITEPMFESTSRQIGLSNYSKFMIKELHRFINTSHALTFHYDGFVQNYRAWDESWLHYDYIGAPWEWYGEKQVGNGGFSLRSKKLIDILAKDDAINEFMPEDDKICRYYHDYLVGEYGIKFAPIEVARRFSIEAYNQPRALQKYDGQFGFHGYGVWNLISQPLPRVKQL